MQIDIKPYEDNTYNCLDILLLTLARNWNIEHRMMFTRSWRFFYSPPALWSKEALLEDMIDGKELVEERDIEYYLETYHGLKLTRVQVDSLEQGIAIMKQQLILNRPLAINIDARYCPWSDAYQKYDLNHYFLGIGVDEEKEEILGIDPYLVKDVIRLPFAEYSQKLKHFICFEYENRKFKKVEWKDIISVSLDYMGGKQDNINKFDCMLRFAEDVRDHLDILKETKEYVDVYASPFVLFMKTVGFSRMNYGGLMAYLAGDYSISALNEFQNKFIKVGNLWYQSFMVLIKMSMMPHRFSSNEVADIIFKVRELEMKLYNQLEALCR